MYKSDLLTEKVFDRRYRSVQEYQHERGRITGLLFMSTQPFSAKDELTVKLRAQDGKTIMIVDHVSMMALGMVCDLKRGIPSITSPTEVFSPLGGGPNPPEALAQQPAGGFMNAIVVDLGHITLDEATLDISLATAPAFGGQAVELQICAIEGPSSPDYIIHYDPSNDLEANHKSVREILLLRKDHKSFFRYDEDQVLQYDRIAVKIDSEDQVYTNSTLALGALTSIFGQSSTAANVILRCFADTDALPASVRVKVSGVDADKAYLLYIKEVMLGGYTSNSTKKNLDRMLKKTEKLEAADPAAAEAYRHAGLTVKSEELKAVQDAVPTSTAPIK